MAVIGMAAGTALAQSKPAAGWPEYGGDAGGQRHSSASQITPANVQQLREAWSLHLPRTGLDEQFAGRVNQRGRNEATPVLWHDRLVFTTGVGQIFAVEAATGRMLWSFDPHARRDDHANLTSRGVALWHARRPAKGVCAADRVLFATPDRRLLALDLESGALCPGFGKDGVTDLAPDFTISDEAGLLTYTSPPVVVGNTVVLGSSIADNYVLFPASGAVRGFDVLTGKQRWAWEPVRWTAGQAQKKSGAGNAWAPLAADPQHDLVFVPTGSASVDFYGGDRLGDNKDADSLVALRASTGEKVWAFQLVHHNVWDFDTASQPLLFTFHGGVPAVAITNKTGMIYVFNRLTGAPLFPINEKPVPKSDLPGEQTWPTQPFSTAVTPLFPADFHAADLTMTNKAVQDFCRSALAYYRWEGLFTPPSQRGTVLYPGPLGGPNWGSSTIDPATDVMYTRVNSLAMVLQLRPRETPTQEKWRLRFDRKMPVWIMRDPLSKVPSDGSIRAPDLGTQADRSLMKGSRYEMEDRPFLGPGNVPCSPQPYGRIVATDLNTGRQLWSVAHGQMVPREQGSIGVGGLISTAGGLLFGASTVDPYLWAYRAGDGSLLWRGALEHPSQATPMTYELAGRQYVVLLEPGRLVAFALPAAQQAGAAKRHAHR